MSKLNEQATTSSASEVEPGSINHVVSQEENKTNSSDSCESSGITKKKEESHIDILKFAPLFNKYNYDLDVKRSSRSGDQDEKHKGTMFFNKEVTIRSNPGSTSKTAEGRSHDKQAKTLPVKTNRNKSRFCSNKSTESDFGKPQISEPDMTFSNSVVTPRNKKTENLKKFLNKRYSKIENDYVVQSSLDPSPRTDLRAHNSLTSLSKNSRVGSRDLKSKIPSLTALNADAGSLTSEVSRIGQWDHWDDLMLMQTDVEKRLNLQISRSTYENNRRSTFKTKKDEVASVSDSKLLLADFELKKPIKKCDKKSRGDSYKRERDIGGRKQVQWKREVDVIYFSTHLAANGDRSGEVIGRVMEPLREEWEQQRQGFYAKLVPYHIESHLKDRFISLLKI